MERTELVVSGCVGGDGPAGVKVTERMLSVAGLFGVEIEKARRPRVLFGEVKIPLGPGEVVLITGPSGAGKSTLLGAISRQLDQGDRVRLEDVDLPADRAIVDCFGGTLEETLAHLARAGLSEARVLLQSPATLSEGQRFRYRLAQFFAGTGSVLIADEFGAILDRVTARVVAYQLGKFVRESVKSPRPRAAVIATTHEDLVEDLRPSVRVHVGLSGRVGVTVSKGGEES